MANPSSAKLLLAVGVLGLVVTGFAAASLDTPASPNATPEAPVRPLATSALAETAPAFGQTVQTAPSAIPAPGLTPPLADPKVAAAAREQACQAEFDKVAREYPIAFLRGKMVPSAEGKASLAEVVVVARACVGMKIEIQGHSDSRGKRQTNIRLSKQRAGAVKDVLVEMGLSPDLMTAVGFGPDRPVASNRNESGRARNRRIEFRVSRGE
jgi:outer membrane protein OmpA-like peptidoglycan-associated protein